MIGVLRDWEIGEDVVDTAELCVSELVTNAVIHSGTPSTVTVRADADYVLIMVHDHGSGGQVRQSESHDPEAIAGRGLALIDTLASAWNVEQSTDGTLVWCELPLLSSPTHTPPGTHD